MTRRPGAWPPGSASSTPPISSSTSGYCAVDQPRLLGSTVWSAPEDAGRVALDPGARTRPLTLLATTLEIVRLTTRELVRSRRSGMRSSRTCRPMVPTRAACRAMMELPRSESTSGQARRPVFRQVQGSWVGVEGVVDEGAGVLEVRAEVGAGKATSASGCGESVARVIHVYAEGVGGVQ